MHEYCQIQKQLDLGNNMFPSIRKIYVTDLDRQVR